ncbi:MAG: DNA gyrase inhibitor YacG [Quisquiliibacterium sp.]
MSRPSPSIDCPACGRKTEFSSVNQWRPFCSERCKTVDLGAWASNAYQIAGASLEEAADPLNSEGQSPSGSESPPHKASRYRQ